MKSGFALLILLFTIALNPFAAGAQTISADYIDGELYVKYHDDFYVDFTQDNVEVLSLPGLNAEIVNTYGIYKVRFTFNKSSSPKLQKTMRLQFSAKDKADELIKYFTTLPFIEYAEKVPAVYPTHTPNDLGANSYDQAWHLHKIKAQNAWDSTKGDANIRVAVVDQEFDINHPDLRDNVWKNPDEIPGNNIDDDFNGYTDDVFGWDCADNDNNVICNTNLNLDHGSPCAGLVAATTNNGIGVSSIGYNISFIPVKTCYDNQTDKLLYYAYEGMTYAAGMKPDIISCSFGSPVNSVTSQNAVDYAVSQGCVVVASAGNDDESQPHYPASYSKVIAVAASRIDDVKASFSNFGYWVDITSPGVSTKTTFQNNNYISFSGTSGACPLTAGLLGLMKSYFPIITNQHLEYCLTHYTDNIDALNPSYAGQLGGGRINAEKAIKCVDSIKKLPPVLFINAQRNILCPDDAAVFSASSQYRNIDSIKWYFPGGTPSSSTSFNPAVKYVYDSLYSISAVAYNRYGKDSVFIQNFIEINSASDVRAFYEDFESFASVSKLTVQNPDNNITWQSATAATTFNPYNKAFKLNCYNYNSSGQRDAFITPPINLAFFEKSYLTFVHAYKPVNINSANDSIIIYGSSDSGKTFPYILFVSGGNKLGTTTSLNVNEFQPSGDNDWCYFKKTCNNISLDSLAGKKNVVLKFESYNDNGNNLFIDNIKVYAHCGDVYTTKPISNFATTDTVTCVNGSIKFTNKTLLSPKSYQWVFAGGTPAASTDANPTVQYTTPGNYDVMLVSTNPIGSDTLVLKNFIRCVAPPTVVLADTQKYVCPGDSVFFTASGTDSVVWYIHSFKKFIYNNKIGDRPVQTTLYSVKAYTPEGCFDSAVPRAVYVPLPPAVSLFAYPDSVTLEAQHHPGNFVYTWYCNDTVQNTLTAKSIKPLKSGNYKLIITDSAGCTTISPVLYFKLKEKTNTGINNPTLSKINIYPNPAKNKLFITGLQEGAATHITIADILGKTMLQQDLADETSINISSFSAGLYIITIRHGANSAIRKIVIE